MIFPNLEVVIQPNRLSVRNLDSGRSASADAPFSCSHLLVDDVDILEHACHELLRQAVGTSWFSFPRVRVSIPGRSVHNAERKIIRDALQNAGAGQVILDPTVPVCGEQAAAQSAYVEKVKRKR
jgi:hypothetical protein